VIPVEVVPSDPGGNTLGYYGPGDSLEWRFAEAIRR
jgi:hypothetical protein